jgi:hypothetical protein
MSVPSYSGLHLNYWLNTHDESLLNPPNLVSQIDLFFKKTQKAFVFHFTE